MASVPTVLYVEDDEGDRFFMEHAFKAAGLGSALRTASDGETAIHYLSGEGDYGNRAEHPLPQLVLLDLNLPNVSGFELLEWIRRDPACRALVVIILSASPREADKSRARALGANDYWEKPNSGLLYKDMVARLRAKWLPSLDTPASAQQPKRLHV